VFTHIVSTALISPFRREPSLARALIGDTYFHEVYVSTSLEVCEQRDVKGLYRRARMGELKAMTGIDSPYEPPEEADVVIDTADSSIEESIDELMGFFGEIGGSIGKRI
jgi:adenylylsulfate kinase-like enzyme